MKKIKFSFLGILCICLAALCIGLIILNAVNLPKLQKYEQTYILSEQGMKNEKQQETINALSGEIVTLKNQLSASNSDSLEQLQKDMNALVHYYFTVNPTSPSDYRMDNMKPYLTEHLFQNLSLKFQDDTINEESKYQSSVQISETYMTPFHENTDMTVLIYCTVTINTVWGDTTSHMMISIGAVYDGTQGRWLANSLSAADQVSFETL